MIILFLLLSLRIAFPIGLDDVKELALRNNLEAIKSEIDLKKLEERIKEVRGGILPSLALSARFTKWDPNYISSFFPENKYSATLSINQSLFDKSLWTAIKLARESKELQRLVIEDVKSRLLTEVEKLYWGVLLRKEILREKEASLEYWENYFKLVEEKFREGIVPRYEFLRARAQFRRAKAELIRARSDYRTALNSLKSFIGVEGDLKLEGKLLKADLPPGVLNMSPLDSSPSLSVLKKTLELKRISVDLKRSEYYPKLSLFLNYTAENVIDFEAGRLKEDIRHGYSFGVQLNFPLFDGGRKGAKVMQEKLEELKASRELEFAKLKLLNDFESLKAQLESAREELLAREDTLLAAEESLRYATERYTEGVGSQVELLEARKNYEEAKLAYLRSVFSYNSILADIKHLLGLHRP